jgi:hypothetical protein
LSRARPRRRSGDQNLRADRLLGVLEA